MKRFVALLFAVVGLFMIQAAMTSGATILIGALACFLMAYVFIRIHNAEIKIRKLESKLGESESRKQL